MEVFADSSGLVRDRFRIHTNWWNYNTRQVSGTGVLTPRSTMKRYVRVTAIPTADSPHPALFVFDLVIDGQGNIVGETDIFGYSYEPGRRTDTCIPLVVDTNGKIDYGVGYDNDQYGETDLLGKRIANGTILEVWGPKYEQPLRISRVEVLVSESGIA